MVPEVGGSIPLAHPRRLPHPYKPLDLSFLPAVNASLNALATVLLVVVGIPVCSAGARALGRHDPAPVVFDEIAAFPIVFAIVELQLTTAIVGFLWFRVFDITKPWPVRRFERLPRGFGIMADDLAAAVYAGGALWLTVEILGLSR